MNTTTRAALLRGKSAILEFARDSTMAAWPRFIEGKYANEIVLNVSNTSGNDCRNVQDYLSKRRAFLFSKGRGKLFSPIVSQRKSELRQ